jgi:hypothetical protein
MRLRGLMRGGRKLKHDERRIGARKRLELCRDSKTEAYANGARVAVDVLHGKICYPVLSRRERTNDWRMKPGRHREAS